jgi:hypothetical protein
VRIALDCRALAERADAQRPAAARASVLRLALGGGLRRASARRQQPAAGDRSHPDERLAPRHHLI